MRFCIAMFAVALTAWLEWAPTGLAPDLGNEWLRDRYLRAQASAAPDQRIAIVDIDEDSIKDIGRWPWPRARIADLVETLIAHYGARGVALDLVFPERADADGDQRLAMLAQHGPVVLGQALDYVPRGAPLRSGTISPGLEGGLRPDLPQASGFIANHAGLSQARHVGNFGLITDADGTVRRLPVQTVFEGRRYPTLSLVLFDCCAQKSAGAASTLAQAGIARVPYLHHVDAFASVTAAEVLGHQAPKELLAGRLVLIGSSALSLNDRVATPLASPTSGVQVHVAMLAALLDEQEGKFPARWPGGIVALLFTLAVALAATRTLPRLSAAANVALLLTASFAWLAVAWVVMPHDPDFSTTGPLAAILFLLTVAVPFDWQIAQRRSRQLLGTLRQYVARAVVDELLRLGLKDPLTPRRLEVTTLIADMQGYTTQVEALSMEEAAQLTRDFLACLTRPVLDKQGTLDKFTGDGLVAFWGAPLPVEDHADLALEAAEAIVDAVRQFSEQRIRQGLQPLRVRIGVESGVAMAGDFGTASRSIFTAVGDSVNVAARLEQMAREFPHDIIVGQGTVDRARRHRFRLLGERTLRGKEKPVTVYTPEKDA